MNVVRLIGFVGLLLFLTACGKKGPVRPLQAQLPEAVRNVELRQRGAELLLGWQLPTRNQNETPLEAPPVVEIYRMRFDPADDCPECKDRSTLLHSINPELPHPARLSGDRYLLRDRQVAAGQGYQYRLVPRTASGQHGSPLQVRIVFAAAPAAPTGLRAKAHDRSATLSWHPLQAAAGQTLLGYRVYRRLEGSGQPAILLNRQPLAALRYDDLNLENGRLYSYRIRALLRHGEQRLESLPSAAVTALPQAGNPPQQPL
jgi:predicted small lipoprotein YifL